MTETSTSNGQYAGPPISELHAHANRLNAKLASGTSAELIREGRQVAQQLLDYVKAHVASYDEFARRVALSEEFTLHESRQVPKTEREYRVHYLRAMSLLEAASEAEARAQKKTGR